MISVIICMRTAILDEKLKDNIAQTIGTPYEIVAIDNSAGQYSIFEAYNIGVQKSGYPYLCFMHDDITYHSVNWGTSVHQYLSDPMMGAIGIAGSPYAPQMPGSWWAGGLVNQQLVKVVDKRLIYETKSTSNDASTKKEVSVLDGVWMCMRRSIFNNISFDEESYKNFHFYDIDICLQISEMGLKNFSVFDVLIEHSSSGSLNKSWAQNALICHEKWKNKLPKSVEPIGFNARMYAEFKTLNEYIRVLLSNNTPHNEVYREALVHLSKFKAGWLYYRMPYYLYKYLRRSYTTIPASNN